MSERADLEGVLSSPLGRVPKLLPNREVSSEGRIIRDLRQVNAFSPKERHPEVKTPTHQEIARKIVQEKAKWPDVPVLMSKRDIDGAFKRVWWDLKDVGLFATDIEARTILEKAYEEALKRDPAHLDSWNNLGITRVNAGDVYGAKAAWQSALGVNRTYCKAHANLGFLAHSRGQIEEAVVEFTTTLSYCPNNLVAHYGLGTIYADDRRNPKRAVAHFEALLSLDPGFSRAE